MTLISSAIGLGLLTGLGALETLRHNRILSRIPIRIHVNGTRGKSSVTRLISAGLRAGGLKVFAKTTGTLPRLIYPDGYENAIIRRARSNIIEQMRFMDLASQHSIDAVVLECMALNPSLQSISERRMIKSTHGIITNARADHLDVMGPSVTDVAKALLGTTPTNGKLYTCESKFPDLFLEACKDRNSELIPVTVQSENIDPLDLVGFSYIEHAENVALALKVCKDLGVDNQTALKGMWQATPDPGVLKDFTIDFFGKTIHFVNAFAANDPESSEKAWHIAQEKFPHAQVRIALFNCRPDRPERSQQLGQSLKLFNNSHHVVLMGESTNLFAREALKIGLPQRQLHQCDNLSVSDIFEYLMGLTQKRTLIVGMGNIGGLGLDLVQYFANRSRHVDFSHSPYAQNILPNQEFV